MIRILFRCDASLLIGSGHVIRCRTLARELRRRGCDIIFICRRQERDLTFLLEEEFKVLSLPELVVNEHTSLESLELYKSTLGCTSDFDSDQCLEVLADAGTRCIDWLVVDHYGLDARWEDRMLSGLMHNRVRPKLLVIDDLANRSHIANLLLDQNFVEIAKDQRYQSLLPSKCRQLLGPYFALLGAEYPLLNQLVPLRKELRRILVFFGGADVGNLTSMTLEALSHPSLLHLSVDVVLGAQSPHWNSVSQAALLRPHTTLHKALPSLAGLITRADLAIGACGSTALERACLNLPSLVITLAPNQVPLANSLDQAKHIKLLGDSTNITKEKVQLALMVYMQNPYHADSSFDLTDGWGTSRVATSMIGPYANLYLRTVSIEDEALLLHWANDPQVRSNSFSHDFIKISDHHHWFHRSLTDPNRLILIAMSGDGCPIGQIRFDFSKERIVRQCSEVIIGLSLDRSARGFGASTEMIRLGLQKVVKHWGTRLVVRADVLRNNAASNACFAGSGFQLDQSSSVLNSTDSVNRWLWFPSSGL